MFQLKIFKASSVFKSCSFAPLFISAFSTVLGRYSAMVTKRKKAAVKKSKITITIRGIKTNNFRDLILSSIILSFYVYKVLYLKKKIYSIPKNKNIKVLQS